MIGLIDLDAAKAHLHIRNTDSDADIEAKILQASAIVMTHCKLATIPNDWIVNSSPIEYQIPYDIQAAVYLETAELYFQREGSVSGVLSEAVQNLLRAYRDPTIA